MRKFAQEVEQRSNGELKFEIFPASSLVKTPAQFGALQKGSIDMTLYRWRTKAARSRRSTSP